MQQRIVTNSVDNDLDPCYHVYVTNCDQREGVMTVDLSERLKKARGDRRREDVAKAVGVSLSAIAMYENGDRVPRDEVKIKLAKLYNTSVQALFFDS